VVHFDKEIVLSANTGELDTLQDWLGAVLDKTCCASRTRDQIAVAAEEIFVNICRYAYSGGEGSARVMAGMDKSRFVMRFEDSGIAFNPLDHASPDITAPIADREPGGLGIFIMRKWMDRVEYSRAGDKNQLTLYKTIGGKKAVESFRNIKIGIKILSVVLSVSLLTLSIISLVSYTQMLDLAKYSQEANVQLGNTISFESKNALLEQAQEYMKNIVATKADLSNARLLQISMELTARASFIEQVYTHPEKFVGSFIPQIPDAPKEIAAAKYMLAPGVRNTADIRQELRLISSAEFGLASILEANSLLNNIYLGTESGIFFRYSESNLYDSAYDPRTRPWYTAAMNSQGRAIWLDTHVDYYGRLLITCSVAFKNSAGVYSGVLATNITPDVIIENIIALPTGAGSYAFLLDKNCTYIAHPRYKEPGFNMNPLEDAEGSWRAALLDMADNIYGTAIVETGGEEYYLFSAPLTETDWKLCVMIPVLEIITPLERVQTTIDTFTLEAQHYIKKNLSSAVMRFAAIFAVAVIFIIAFSYTLSLAITRPIEVLSRNVRKIGEGALDIQIPVNGSDEVAELGKAFNRMTGDLKGYILNIEKVTAEKERINSELNISAKIQNDMLPANFPKFSGNEYFSVFAKMVPAKEVGGDFYDFFYLDEKETKLALVIADVSGKGVPASLFMVIAKTLVKQQMLHTNDPAGTLTAVNKLLCENNPRSMFVTVLICSIDLVSGEMIYTNAGHNPPLVSTLGGGYQFMELKRGLPPGMMETSVYRQCSMQLHSGDKLYLYTDGINEAMNRENKEWGNDRFLKTANKYIDLGPEAFDTAIRARLTEFVSGAEQSDDITTIAFTYNPLN
jgi:sigma-B regulation protein RsbU (phosphoserine phosphatase)